MEIDHEIRPLAQKISSVSSILESWKKSHTRFSIFAHYCWYLGANNFLLILRTSIFNIYVFIDDWSFTARFPFRFSFVIALLRISFSHKLSTSRIASASTMDARQTPSVSWAQVRGQALQWRDGGDEERPRGERSKYAERPFLIEFSTQGSDIRNDAFVACCWSCTSEKKRL